MIVENLCKTGLLRYTHVKSFLAIRNNVPDIPTQIYEAKEYHVTKSLTKLWQNALS